VHEPGEIPLKRDTKYVQYEDICSLYNVRVPVTSKLIGKNQSVYKVSIVPDAVDHYNKFALIVSTSHLIGDNYTYYKLFHMLNPSTKVEELNPIRVENYKQQVEKLMGAEEAYYFEKSNPDFVDQILSNYNKDQKEKETLLFTVSQEWLDYQMKQCIMDAERAQDAEESSSSLPPVRPAEVILSWWFKLSNADIGMIPHQLRDHLEVLSDTHAGNYNNPIPYTKADYATPYLIRDSLQTCRRSAKIPIPETSTVSGSVSTSITPLPKISTGKSFALGIDWNQFYPQAIQFRSDDQEDYGIEEDLHLPLFTAADLLAFPSKISTCVLFTAKNGATTSSGEEGSDDDDDSAPKQRIGVFVVAKKEVCEIVMASGIVDEDIKSSLTKEIVNKRGSMMQFAGLPNLEEALGLDLQDLIDDDEDEDNEKQEDEKEEDDEEAKAVGGTDAE
jgi:hypothetical protein